jgi:hypothetical protein
MAEPIAADCPGCSARLKVRPALPANGRVMCPSCGLILALAAPAAPTTNASRPAPIAAPQRPMPKEPPRLDPPEDVEESSFPWLPVGIVIAVAVVLAAWMLWAWR